MKKKTKIGLTAFALLLGCLSVYSQKEKYQEPPLENQILVELKPEDTNVSLRSITYNAYVFKNTYEVYKFKSKIKFALEFSRKIPEMNQHGVKFLHQSYTVYNFPDTSNVSLLAFGITPENVADFKYHVVENDSIEIVPWSPIPRLENKLGLKKAYAFIGKYRKPNSFIFIEVVNTKDYKIRDGIIFSWQTNLKPQISKILLTSRLNTKAQNFQNKISIDSAKDIDIYFKDHPIVDYQIDLLKKNKNGTYDTSYYVGFSESVNRILINYGFYNAPGYYKFLVRKSGFIKMKEAGKVEIPFEILPSKKLSSKVSLKQVILYSGIVLILFLLYFIYSRRKLLKAKQLKEKTELQLKSLRLQLNPHFMFNALNSIQNLMNRKDADASNHYLSIFSSLTRKVLDSSELELISLEDEIQLLSDYLQMEQLRFGFQFSINADSTLNKANLEIPAMLLQPIIENSVKHGVSTLRENGLVEINFKSDGKALKLIVADNGKGFDSTKIENSNGLGIKLNKERIALLNKVYPKQPITMEFNKKDNGTEVMIILNDWM